MTINSDLPEVKFENFFFSNIEQSAILNDAKVRDHTYIKHIAS